jgi:hypothetical protein
MGSSRAHHYHRMVIPGARRANEWRAQLRI